MKFTKVMIFLLGIFFIGIPGIALAQNNYLLGKHFADLQEQIDTIQLTPGPAGPQGPMEPAGQNAPLPPNGTQVGPGLYHVHTRVLWDLGWLTDYTYLSDDDFFTYWEKPTPLVYGPGRTLFLSPLEGHGIPGIRPGATRKVRLYVNYGHQRMCGGTPTVKIVSETGAVEFSLPQINGYYGDMGANWSDFKDYLEYENIGHAEIQIYQKGFYWGGPHCGQDPSLSTGPDQPKGVIYRIEAHFYDQY